eukprot:GHVQ01002499.1.p1 GENE.GHVQ01002499.1~~GHVQ01002499.1.p1  ORF type:complete len:285 (-),score=68.85 GHVQ01002499.1:109-963(-)
MQYLCQAVRCLEFLRARREGAVVGGERNPSKQGYDPVENMDFIQNEEDEWQSDDEEFNDWSAEVSPRLSGRPSSTSAVDGSVSHHTAPAVMNRTNSRRLSSASPVHHVTADGGGEQQQPNGECAGEHGREATTTQEDRDLFSQLGMEPQYRIPPRIKGASQHNTTPPFTSAPCTEHTQSHMNRSQQPNYTQSIQLDSSAATNTMAVSGHTAGRVGGGGVKHGKSLGRGDVGGVCERRYSNGGIRQGQHGSSQQELQSQPSVSSMLATADLYEGGLDVWGGGVEV